MRYSLSQARAPSLSPSPPLPLSIFHSQPTFRSWRSAHDLTLTLPGGARATWRHSTTRLTVLFVVVVDNISRSISRHARQSVRLSPRSSLADDHQSTHSYLESEALGRASAHPRTREKEGNTHLNQGSRLPLHVFAHSSSPRSSTPLSASASASTSACLLWPLRA